MAPPHLLAGEILDEIFSHIEHRSDLVNLACVCRTFSFVVIPRHTEYRVIKIQSAAPFVWAHLARRRDLTKGIREVHVLRSDDLGVVERYPTTLIDEERDYLEGGSDDVEHMMNVTIALREMKNLKVFHWHHTIDLVKPTYQRLVLKELTQRDALVELSFSQDFARAAEDAGDAELPTSSPITLYWDLPNLRRLQLKGDAANPVDDESTLQLIRSSPSLVEFESSSLFLHRNYASIDLPKLRDLVVDGHHLDPLIYFSLLRSCISEL